jgi:hypothetical protein
MLWLRMVKDGSGSFYAILLIDGKQRVSYTIPPSNVLQLFSHSPIIIILVTPLDD